MTAQAKDEGLVRLMDYIYNPPQYSWKRLTPACWSSTDLNTTYDRLLYYTAAKDETSHVVVPVDNNLLLLVIYEFQFAATNDHCDRDENYFTLSRDFYWPIQYQHVRKYVIDCEVL